MCSVSGQRATVLWRLLGYLLKDLGKGFELAFWPPAAMRPAQKSVGICDVREDGNQMLFTPAPPLLLGKPPTPHTPTGTHRRAFSNERGFFLTLGIFLTAVGCMSLTRSSPGRELDIYLFILECIHLFIHQALTGAHHPTSRALSLPPLCLNRLGDLCVLCIVCAGLGGEWRPAGVSEGLQGTSITQAAGGSRWSLWTSGTVFSFLQACLCVFPGANTTEAWTPQPG